MKNPFKDKNFKETEFFREEFSKATEEYFKDAEIAEEVIQQCKVRVKLNNVIIEGVIVDGGAEHSSIKLEFALKHNLKIFKISEKDIISIVATDGSSVPVIGYCKLKFSY